MIEKIKILIVDDHAVLREGIKAVLELRNEFTIVGEADSGFKACEFATSLKPDIILMDIKMEQMDGIKASRNIKYLNPEIKILLLTMYEEAEYILEALKIGIEGYILKLSDMDKVINAIKIIMDDETYYDPKITKSIAEIKRDPVKKIERSEIFKKYELTPREIEIAFLLVDGLSTREVSEKLNLSTFTISNHKKNIFAKLKISRFSELINFAIHEGVFIFKDENHNRTH
ncbi:MAG: response regulator transcription factor [Ignavibacteriaceae bacterium]